MSIARSVVAVSVLAVGTLAAASCSGDRAAERSTERFDLGELSTEEQMIWFLVNRARADPAAEGRWLATNTDPLISQGIEAFGVDVEQLIADFDRYPPRPPVAWDRRLAAAAERHATDQATARRQSHAGSDGTRPAQRVRDEGAETSFVVENVSGFVHSPEFGHAAFQIDWGGAPPTGVQEWPTPAHRFAIMSARTDLAPANVVGMSYRPAEAGDDEFGPNVLVQEFARIDATFVVGTVWSDDDGDGTLDLGEGVGDAVVEPEHGGRYTVTASEGGFVLPVTSGETITMSVSADGFDPVIVEVSVGTENELVDIEVGV